MIPVIYAVSDCDAVTSQQYGRLITMVSAERKARAQRFLRFEDSCRSVIAEVLLAYTLRQVADLELSRVTLIENQWKKPIIQGHDVHFNITHSGKWVMCIVDKCEAGIDVEKVKHVDFGIVPRFFSTREQELFNRCTTDELRLNCFSTLWVLKESYIKAIGRGLHCPLDSFSVIPDMYNNVTLERNDPALPDKFLKIYPIGENYKCAACCSTKALPDGINMLTVNDLL
ncbi:MAG TPA: 4'-phosphopantetheinyl transferase superfamily protein [Chitinispirillaceae bacterium]|nr:4'-phosphopantetheinyl transferase superfamily protein [Chitinispirillaceae bacterium]